MRGKMAFLAGLAVGFVLGTREGRERYDQIVRKARQIMDHPTVQEAKGVVQAQANRLYEEGRDVVNDKLSHSRVGERLLHSRNGTEMMTPADPVTRSTTNRNSSSGI